MFTSLWDPLFCSDAYSYNSEIGRLKADRDGCLDKLKKIDAAHNKETNRLKNDLSSAREARVHYENQEAAIAMKLRQAESGNVNYRSKVRCSFYFLHTSLTIGGFSD